MKFVVIAGPCVIESRDIVFEIASELRFLADDSEVEFYFKASFDKANRTSIKSFRGPGLKEGLKILDEVKSRFGYKLLTDVHECVQVPPAAEVVDFLQIPAFLCRQTDLIVECAKTDRMVNIKKGQFMAPEAMRYSVLKVLQTRGKDEASYENSLKKGVWLTERGSSFGYNNLVVDFRSLPIMREFAPVIFDATHSVQRPNTGESSGGDSKYAPLLAKAATSIGIDGLFAETHIEPSKGLSDSANMLKISELKELIESVKKIRKVV